MEIKYRSRGIATQALLPSFHSVTPALVSLAQDALGLSSSLAADWWRLSGSSFSSPKQPYVGLPLKILWKLQSLLDSVAGPQRGI